MATRPTISGDNTIKIDYNPQINKIRFPLNCVGPDGVITLTEPMFADTDANSIYVSSSTGSDSNAGTFASPVATINYAISLCTVTKIYVIIKDNSDYMGELACTNAFFSGLYKDTGSTARLTIRLNDYTSSDVNTIYVSKSGVDTNSGTFAAPVLTLEKAKTLCTPSIVNVKILDSGAYTCPEFSGYFQNLYSDEFEQPTITGYSYWFNQMDVGAIIPDTVGVYDYAGTIRTHVVLSNGNIMFVSTQPSTNYGVYSIISPTGVVVTGTTVFAGEGTSNIKAVMLASGRIGVFWGGYGGVRWCVLNQDGSVYKSIDTLSSGGYTYTCATVVSTNNIAVFYTGNFTSIYYQIITESGSVVKAEALLDASYCSSIDCCTTSTGAMAVFYSDYSDSEKGKWIIVNTSGTITKAEAVFNSATTLMGGCISLPNGDIMCQYRGTAYDPMKSYVTTQSGTEVKRLAYTTSDGYNLQYGCGLNYKDSETIYQIYQNGTMATIVETSSASIYSAIPVKLFGLNIQNKYTGKLSASATIRNCFDYHDDKIFGIYSSSNLLFYNSGINGSCVAVGNTTKAYNTYFIRGKYSAGLYIDGAATSSGDITIQNCDFVNCYGGINLQNNNGVNEIIKNNIISGNGAYGITAETTVTQSYSINTDINVNTTNGTNVVLNNPLFVNEGSINPEGTDLHIKKRVLGYRTDSPAYLLGQDGYDAGAYKEAVIGSSTSWDTLTVRKPEVIPIKVKYANAVNNIMADGSIDSYADGFTEYLELKWQGLLASEFEYIYDLWLNTESEVRVYFNPTTYPNTYYTYTIMRDDLNASASEVVYDDDAKEDFSIFLARKIEAV